MKIIIDAMSGDNAPHEIIKGAVLAKKELPCGIILVGDEKIIRESAEAQKLSLDGIEIVHASEVITMEDAPLAIREKRNSSMRVGFKLLHDGVGDAFVGAGNTGAMHVGSTLFVRRIPGIRRSAIAGLLPLEKPLLLIDSGANIEVTEEFLHQFAIMGSIYMKNMFGIEKPRIGLLNNGTEEAKGTPLYVNTYKMLTDSPFVNFVGNIEGKDIPFGKCDVLVCDGFTGNIALKTLEGMGLFIMKKVKRVFTSNFFTKLAYLLCKKKVASLRRELDTSEYGGAPFLGIAAPVIKAHGSSDARAIKNAVRQAITCVETNIIGEISEIFKTIKTEATEQTD